VVEIKIENFISQNKWKMRRAAFDRGPSVLSGGIGFVCKTPISGAAISPLCDWLNITSFSVL
jgi:hypothetical protein